MKKIILLLSIISIYGRVYGDVESECKSLFAKSKKEANAENYTKALAYLVEAKTIAEKNNSTQMLIHTLVNMGAVYSRISDNEKAMDYFLEAYQIAIKEPTKYKIEEITILNNMAVSYVDNIDKVEEYTFKAYQGAVELQDSLRIGVLAMNLASYFNKTGDLEQAEKYLNIGLNIFKTQDSLFMFYAKIMRVENLYLKKEYNKAEKLALELLNQNYTFSDTNYIYSKNDLKIELLLLLSKIYQQKKEFQKAITVTKDALNRSPKLPLIVEIYEQLSKIYLEIDAPYLANQYLNSMILAKDSLNKITNMSNIMINQAKFDLINSEKALAENKAKQREERIFFTFIAALIILSALILIIIFRMQVAKNKQLKTIAELELEKQTNEKLLLEQDNKMLEQDKLLLEQEKLLLEQKLKEQEVLALLEQKRQLNEKLLLEQQLKEQEITSLLEQKRLQDEIDTKNRQLASKMLFLSNKNELIKEIIATLTKIPDHSKNPILKTVIKKLKTQVKKNIDWNSFLIYFEQINSSFLSALKEKHPDLTANEIRFLSYIYLNFDAKEISKLFNITPDYCRKKKHLLAKKMKVPASKMHQYLTNL